MSSIVFQIAHNKVLFGNGLEVDVRLVGHEGRVQIQSPNGPTLRPLGFGERNRLVRLVALSSNIPQELATVITNAAVTEPGSVSAPASIVQALALHFSGAGSRGPGFSTQVGILSNQLGWTPRELELQSAMDVDVLGAQWLEALGSVEHDDGWNRIVMNPTTSASPDADQSIDDIVKELAGELLARFHEPLNRKIFNQAPPHPAKKPLINSPTKKPGTKFSPAGSNPSSSGQPSSSLQPSVDQGQGSANRDGNQEYPQQETNVSTNPASPVATSPASPPHSEMQDAGQANTISQEKNNSGDFQNKSSLNTPMEAQGQSPGFTHQPTQAQAGEESRSSSHEETVPFSEGTMDSTSIPFAQFENLVDVSPDPATLGSGEYDWSVLGLNTTPSMDEGTRFPTIPAGISNSNQIKESTRRAAVSSNGSTMQPHDAAPVNSVASYNFLQTPRGGSTLALETLKDSINTGPKEVSPFQQQDLVQAVAEALNRMADLRGIDS